MQCLIDSHAHSQNILKIKVVITGLAVPSRISRDDFVFQFVCLSSVRLFTCFLFYTRCCLSAYPKPSLKSQLEVYLVSPKHVFHCKIGLSSGNIT